MRNDDNQNPPTDLVCPAWCCIDHRGAHPEDLIHQDAGTLVPAVVRPPGLHQTGEADLLIIQRNRRLDDTHDWIDIQSAEEGTTRLVLSLESAERVLAALRRAVDQRP